MFQLYQQVKATKIVINENIWLLSERRKDSHCWWLMLMLIELMWCVSTIPMMKSVITERKSWNYSMETLWFVYNTRIFTVLSYKFSKLSFFYVRGTFFSSDFHIVAICLLCIFFLSFTKMFMASMSIDLFILMMWSFIAFFFFSLESRRVLRKRDCFLNFSCTSKFWNIFQSKFLKHLRR